MNLIFAHPRTGLRRRWNAFWRNRDVWKRRLPLIGSRLVRKEVIGRYRRLFGASPRLDPPRTFNEHIIHRTIYDRDPRLKILSDKIAVRGFISERIGSEFLVPLLGVWQRAADIEWDRLPERFVLKPSHSSGFVAFIEGPARRDIPRLTAEAQSWLGHDYFDLSCEWGYRGIPRAVLAEPLLEPPGNSLLIEVQAFCFHGKARLFRFLFGRKGVTGRSDAWFDATGRRVAVAAHISGAPYALADGLRRRLIALAEPLAAGFSSLRVDFYLIGVLAFAAGGRMAREVVGARLRPVDIPGLPWIANWRAAASAASSVRGEISPPRRAATVAAAGTADRSGR